MDTEVERSIHSFKLKLWVGNKAYDTGDRTASQQKEFISLIDKYLAMHLWQRVLANFPKIFIEGMAISSCNFLVQNRCFVKIVKTLTISRASEFFLRILRKAQF